MATGKADIRVDLLRHGEPVGGRAFRGNGRDDPLSDRGWQQMRDALPEVLPWNRVVTSPMRRCREFAAEVAERLSVELEVEDDLREVGFGEWEGHTHEAIAAADAGAYHAFYADPVNNRPPGAEPLADFVARVDRAWARRVAPRDGDRVLVVAHAGVIRATLACLLAMPPASLYRVRIVNAAYTRFTQSRAGAAPVLAFVNGTREALAD